MIDDLDILPGGMEHLDDGLIAHQLEEGRKVEPGGQCVDDEGIIRASQLDNAELRPEGRLAQEFRVHSHVIMGGKALAGVGEVRCGRDQIHGNSGLYRRLAILSP